MSDRWVRFWALVYRVTYWYSPFAELAEHRALKKWLSENDYKVSGQDVDVQIGLWQAHYGFYRKFE